MVRTHSHGSIEEEDIEMENRAEIVKIHEKLAELETLKSDVAEIKALLITNLSQSSTSGNGKITGGTWNEWPSLTEAGMASAAQLRHLDVSNSIASQHGSSHIPVATSMTWNLEQNKSGRNTSPFFVEPNTVIPDLSPVFSPVVRTTAQVETVTKLGGIQMGNQPSPAAVTTMGSQVFHPGVGITPVPPWSGQMTNQTTAALMYYHPVWGTNPGQETLLNHCELNGNMGWNTNGNKHQSVDAMIRGPKLEIPLFLLEIC